MPTINLVNQEIEPLSAIMGGTQTFATLPALFNSLGMSSKPAVVQVQQFINVCGLGQHTHTNGRDFACTSTHTSDYSAH
jgi:hypothetical protein